MKYKLLSNRWKTPGWLLFFSALVAGIIVSNTGYEVSWLHIKTFTLFDAELFGKSRWLQIWCPPKTGQTFKVIKNTLISEDDSQNKPS